MTRSTDPEFLTLKEKQRHAQNLKDLLENQTFKLLMEGMLKRRIQLADESDSFDVTTDVAEKKRMMRTAIKVFLDQIVFSLTEGERAQNKISEILKLEDELQKRKYKEKGIV